MTLPRTYRDWRIDVNPDAPASMFWQAVHKDYDASYEGPEDGWVASHPVLSAATEKDLMVEIDCWHMEQDDEDIAAIAAAADALRSLAERHGLTYASIDFYGDKRVFWSCKGHNGPLAKSGTGSTIPAAIESMLSSEYFDTSTVEKAA